MVIILRNYKWSNPLMVGNEWQWYAGNSRQGHSLPLGVGYYLYRKDSHAWQILGTDWAEASNALIKMGLAKPFIAKKVSIADEGNLRVEAALKKRPNRSERATTSY